MKTKMYFGILLASCLMAAPSAFAQTASKPARKPAQKPVVTTKPNPIAKPKMDIDAFFKDAEKKTREEYDKGGNCLPKLDAPKDETLKPVV